MQRTEKEGTRATCRIPGPDTPTVSAPTLIVRSCPSHDDVFIDNGTKLCGGQASMASIRVLPFQSPATTSRSFFCPILSRRIHNAACCASSFVFIPSLGRWSNTGFLSPSLGNQFLVDRDQKSHRHDGVSVVNHPGPRSGQHLQPNARNPTDLAFSPSPSHLNSKWLSLRNRNRTLSSERCRRLPTCLEYPFLNHNPHPK